MTPLMLGQTLIVGVVVIAIILVLVIMLVMLYNGLVRRRIDCENGWAQIDVQLKRRYDLIPNLVETVKGYAGHERETLEAVIAARTRAVDASKTAAGPAERGKAEGELTAALGRLFAVAEAYPDLKANQNFSQLQEELTSTENKIGFARQHYNDCVARYDNARQTFPSNIVAGMFNFTKREYFEVLEPATREAPKVSFS